MRFSNRKLMAILTLALLLVFNFTGYALAASKSMPGMDMSGSNQNTMPGMDMSGSNQNTMPGMDMSGSNQNTMPGMDMSGSNHNSAVANAQGVAGSVAAHSATRVNWYVIGGFLVINSLIILTAALTKPAVKSIR